MVKLTRSKPSQGMSSQMGLLRFSEEMSKGLKIDPQVLVLGVALIAVLLYLFSLFSGA